MCMHSVCKRCNSKRQYNVGRDILDDKVVVNSIYEPPKEDEKEVEKSTENEMEESEYTSV